MSNNVRVFVYDSDRDRNYYKDNDWPPDSLIEAIDWLRQKLEMIPAEHQKSATVEFGSEGGYEGSHSPTIVIEYWRPETAEEKAERERLAAQRRAQERAHELTLLHRLTQKYGPVSGAS